MIQPYDLNQLGYILKEAKRELTMKQNYYPRMVAAGRMSQKLMDNRIKIQEATVILIEHIVEHKKTEKYGKQVELFDGARDGTE